MKLKCARLILSALVMLLLAPWQIEAQTPGSPAKSDDVYKKIWKFAEWYKNDQNPAVQSLLFSGRFQYEYASINADQGDHSEWNVRRMRVGAKSKLFRTLTLHGEVELNPEEAEPFYVRLTDMYLQWSRSETFALTTGKQATPFTMEGSTSSKELLTIDRSNLANNMWFPQEYFPGVAASGDVNGWQYHSGVYSSGEMNREFGEFNGSFFTLASIGRDIADTLGAKEALLRANYVYQNPDPSNTFTRPLQHVVSVNFKFEDDKWGVRTDVSAAAGYLGQSDLWGLVILPFYNINPKLQIVARETYLHSSNPNGVRIATYENAVVPGRGDRYQEIYAGVNYLFYGHKLKVQSGAQWGDMDDQANDGGEYNGFSWVTGLRVSW
ncbi:MAG TPA: porin [Terriglobia bacterium]|nr:porin [Terriglobia bacterium]